MAPTTPSTLLLLVRHGLTASTGKVLYGRSAGVHLSEAGQQQAARVAARISALVDEAGRHRVGTVVASPLERTVETAQPIAAGLGVPVTIDDGLLEADFGEWTGRELAHLRRRKDWSTIQQNPSRFRFPGGESFSEMQHRMVTTSERLCATRNRRRGSRSAIVAVSHADPIKALVAHAAGTHLDHFQRLVISPCSVTALLYGAHPPILLCVNSSGDDLGALALS